MTDFLMMHIILTEIKQNQQKLGMDDLCKQLQIDMSMLDGIVTKLVRHGYLREVKQEGTACPYNYTCATCPLRESAVPITTYRLAGHEEERRRRPLIHIIMSELRRNQQELSLTDLSQRLKIDRLVLEGMVMTLVRRGYLVEVKPDDHAGPCECGCTTCPRRAAPAVQASTYRLSEREMGRKIGDSSTSC